MGHVKRRRSLSATGTFGRRRIRKAPLPGLIAVLLCCAQAHGLQVLEAADHAELEAEISGTAVSRIALENDRVIRVVQAPGGLSVEHDPVRGDVYLYPDGRVAGDGEPVVLYLGTEQGRTYRLSLTPADRGSAQILIRNRMLATLNRAKERPPETHADDLVKLIRAVARREPLPGYSIVSAAPGAAAGTDIRTVESWRGPRWTARVLSVPDEGPVDAGALAARYGSNVVAAWMSERGGDSNGGRLAVIVEPTEGWGATG